MTHFNHNYQQQYTQCGYDQTANQPLGGELTDGMTVSASDLGDYDKGYVLLPEGQYPFTVVNLEESRYQPSATSKIGPCKQITLTLRVKDPTDNGDVDLKHNLYMFNNQGCLGMIASFYDAVGMHRKGEPITFDWRQNVIVGKTGILELSHRKGKDGNSMYNNIKKLLPFSGQVQQQPTIGNPTPNAGNWSNGRF